MESIDLSKISNLEHRAVIKAVLESELPFVEIQNKLNVSKSNFYWIIRKYLPANFLEERKQHEQLKKLSSLVGKDEISSSDPDKVGIISLPSPVGQVQQDNVENSEAYWDQPRYEKMYQLLDYYLAEDENRKFPTFDTLGNIVYQEKGTHPSKSDLAVVMRKWKELHPYHPALNRPRLRVGESTTNLKQQQKESITKRDIHIEIGKIKISWSSKSDDVESAIDQVITGLKDFIKADKE